MAKEEKKKDASQVAGAPIGGQQDSGVERGMGNSSHDENVPRPMPDWEDVEELPTSDEASDPFDKAARNADDNETLSGTGDVEDRGTVTGVGTAGRGGTGGGGSSRMKGRAARDKRSTDPLSDQAPPGGAGGDDTD